MGHIIDKSLGGTDTPDNFRAVCMNCNEGLSNTSPPKPKRLNLCDSSAARRSPTSFTPSNAWSASLKTYARAKLTADRLTADRYL